MMTFKQFYLQNTKDNKKAPRSWRSLKRSRLTKKLLDRLSAMRITGALFQESHQTNLTFANVSSRNSRRLPNRRLLMED